MFQKWDLDGNNALDREEFGAVFGASVEGSKRRERRAIELGDAVMRAEDPTRDDVRSLKEELETLKAQMAAMMEEKKSEGGDPPRDPSGATGSSALEFDGGYVVRAGSAGTKAAAAEPPRSLRGASYRSYLESPAFRSGARRARSGSPGSAGAGGPRRAARVGLLPGPVPRGDGGAGEERRRLPRSEWPVPERVLARASERDGASIGGAEAVRRGRRGRARADGGV